MYHQIRNQDSDPADPLSPNPDAERPPAHQSGPAVHDSQPSPTARLSPKSASRLKRMNSTSFTLPPSFPPTETLYYPALPTNTSEDDRETYFLFLPGNPGLIEYYRSFLGTLSSLLGRRIHVLGVSHAGFHTRQTAARGEAPYYWTLEEQVLHKVQLVEWLVGRGGREKVSGKQVEVVEEGEKDSGDEAEEGGAGWIRSRRGVKVIIAGHSVGTFIAMEVLRILGERRKKRKKQAGEREAEGEVKIVGGVMLFPTVVDIAKSPNGRILNGLLTITSRLPLLVSHISHPLSILPTRLVYALIRTVTAHPPSAAATTLSLLTTPGAVFQALSMARDEMEEITHDRWDYDIWGSEKAGVSKLWFYFGEKDYWVAEDTREAIIKTRGRGMGEDWKPRMVVGEAEVPHGFCIDHGEAMAEKVCVWVQGMLEG